MTGDRPGEFTEQQEMLVHALYGAPGVGAGPPHGDHAEATTRGSTMTAWKLRWEWFRRNWAFVAANYALDCGIHPIHPRGCWFSTADWNELRCARRSAQPGEALRADA